jgi:perosamine synthetase
MSDLFNHIPICKPWMEEEEWLSLKDVILSGWISQGPKVQEFENQVAEFVGAKYAVATNACTSAMHLIMRYLGVVPGDEVIVASWTCMANINAILMAGATPVLVDVDFDTTNLDPEKVVEAITEKTKAIMVIDQLGTPAGLDAFKDISRKYNIKFFNDSAVALGSKYKGKFTGGHGVPTSFSFHPRKMISTGEGGMLVTDDENLAYNARRWRATGASVSDLERHKNKGIILQEYPDSGYNYRMTDIQAMIGIVQMKKLPEMIRVRNEQSAIFNEAFKNIEELILPFIPEESESCYSSYFLRLSDSYNKTNEYIVNEMASLNISCRMGIRPLHQELFFQNRGFKDVDFPNSCKLGQKGLFLPIYPGLTNNEINYIISSLTKVILG